MNPRNSAYDANSNLFKQFPPIRGICRRVNSIHKSAFVAEDGSLQIAELPRFARQVKQRVTLIIQTTRDYKGAVVN